MPDTNPSTISVTFYRSSHDNQGVQAAVTWSRLIDRLSRHDPGDKDGPAMAVATFSGIRRNTDLVSRSMIALDIESSKTTGEVAHRLRRHSRLSGRQTGQVIPLDHAYAIRRAIHRYRILLPLDAPLPV